MLTDIKSKCQIEASRLLSEHHAGRPVDPYSLEWARWISGCPKCFGLMRPGVALAQTYGGSPDDIGGDVVTMSPAGPGKLIYCSKCVACGHSISIGVSTTCGSSKDGKNLAYAAPPR